MFYQPACPLAGSKLPQLRCRAEFQRQSYRYDSHLHDPGAMFHWNLAISHIFDHCIDLHVERKYFLWLALHDMALHDGKAVIPRLGYKCKNVLRKIKINYEIREDVTSRSAHQHNWKG